MGAANPTGDATPHVVRVRCGRRRADGSRCKKSWFMPTNGEVIPWGDVGWRGERWQGPRFVAQATQDRFLVIGETRWEIPCTKRCGAHPTVKKTTLEAAVRSSLENGDGVVWLADLAS